MGKIKRITELPSRSTIYAITGIIVALAIGLAAIAHADEQGNTPERPERSEGGRRGALVHIAAKLNLLPDLSIVVNNDNKVNVHGATVTATSTSGLTATTATPPLTFIVQTDASTKFNVKGIGNGSLADIAIGDTVNFRGIALSGTTTSTWTVKATNVEDKMRHPKPPKPPKMHATTTENATTTAQFRVDALLKVIERLQAIVDQLKIRFGL